MEKPQSPWKARLCATGSSSRARANQQPDAKTVTSDEWRVDSPSPMSRLPSLAPSQCPRHPPASFIGGSWRRLELVLRGRASGAGSNPSSGLVPPPPSPLGEGKHSFYAPLHVIGFPSPRRRGWAGEPQRGDLTKPRLKAWVNGTQTDTRALKGRNNPFQSHTYRSSQAIPCASSSLRNSS